jgi:hypothetical protein
MGEPGKYIVDAGAIVITVGTIAQYLPPIAAAFTIVWTGLQIYGWFEKRRARKSMGQRIFEDSKL